MVEYFVGDVKRMLKIATGLTIIVLVLGIVLRREELYFACFLGCLVSIVNIILLHRDCKNAADFDIETAKRKAFTQFFRRYVFYAIALFIVAYVIRKYHIGKVGINIMFCGLGLLVFKISMYIEMFLSSRKK